MHAFLVLVGAALSCSRGLAYRSRALEDEVDYAELPGADGLGLSFRTFAGYLRLPGPEGKHIMYLFNEASDVDPDTAPVTLWTNGGPGCSGFLGAFSEQGPFRPILGGSKLDLNPFAWNQRSNMLFIEQPAGVGFSFANDTSAYKTGDSQAATDNFLLLQAFLERFPQYAANPLYLTSESYGGHYMPTLAMEILEKNPEAGATGHVNFRGFAVGNPYTQAFSNNVAMYKAYYGHQLVSKPTYDKWEAECTGNKAKKRRDPQLLAYCNGLEALLSREASTVGASLVNPYALSFPVCLENGQTAQQRQLLRYTQHDGVRELLEGDQDLHYEPCEEDWVANYLNRDDVKQAIHAREDLTWASCSAKVRYSEVDMQKDMALLYPKILEKDPSLKVLVYSGDDDAVCATWGTQAWIYDLGYSVKKYWKTWTTYDGQLGGFYTQFAGVPSFGFATVHGAGHEVPAYKPEAALKLFDDFVSGEWFA